MNAENGVHIVESEKEIRLLQDVLRLDEQDSSLVIDEVDVAPGCSHGDNYMSMVTRVQIRGTMQGEKNGFSRSVVMKRQPNSKVYRDLFNCSVLFLNEKATYYDILPAFQRFSRGSRRLPYPKCLHASEEVIILDDLRPSGYLMADRRKGLDFSHCKLVFQELAAYHALSFAMKLKEPEKFKTVRESIKETIYITKNKSQFSPALENAFKIALFSLRSMSREDPALLIPIKLLENVNKHLFKRMMKFVKPREPFAVINHGDCWINNILFKYQNDNEMNVTDIRLLDLQVTRYSSPAIDLLHLFYTSIQDAVRTHHFDSLLVYYHAALVESLRRLLDSNNVEQIFTLEQLRTEMRVSALYGLINGLWLLPAVTVDSDTLPNMEEFSKDDLYSQENIDHWITHQTQDYKDRIRHLVLEYVERGYL